ncbi:hypothetical protein [Novosphingobium terrae]|uniref:hypothetical protein n=1 Tax=Novosphingobium terrae TaxID=2726189 RepID=UPI00197E79D8|nr:hypothetical protein [Novosphingobium terrae]
MASNPSDGTGPSERSDRQTVQMTHADLHEVSWKAQLLAQAAKSVLGEMETGKATMAEGQAMFDLLWRVGFRPSDGC